MTQTEFISDIFGGGCESCLARGLGPGRSPLSGPGGQSPPGSRREIGKMRVKIQSPRLHFPVLFLCKIIHCRLSDYYGSHCSDPLNGLRPGPKPLAKQDSHPPPKMSGYGPDM
jgi:hypothetical protein